MEVVNVVFIFEKKEKKKEQQKLYVWTYDGLTGLIANYVYPGKFDP